MPQVNAPEVFPYQGKFYFQVGQANDQNLSIVPFNIGLANSAGTITTIATIDWTAQLPGVNTCYSGGWLEDAGNVVHLFIPCSIGDLEHFSIYETHATDTTLVNWSYPSLISINEANVYDSQVFLIGSTYYMWLSSQTTHFVELASASALLGPYTMQKTGDWAGWGSPKEGPTMYSTGPTSWRLAIEDISGGATAHQMYYSDCNTLDLLACTWTSLTPWTEDHLYRHGSILKN